MDSPAETPAVAVPTDLRLRQMERERNFLIAVAALLLGLLSLSGVGHRVWAIAVRDSAQHEFVEWAYLAQRGQAEQVLKILTDNAQKRHPFYKDNAADFKKAAPSFQEQVVIRRVRRATALPVVAQGQTDLPVQRAAAALSGVLHVQVSAISLYDEERQRSLVVLPNEAMVVQAQEARLDSIGRKVAADLKSPDYLVEKPTIVQKVRLQPVTWPVDQVLTVQQAVDYLTSGSAPALHVVQSGERAKDIAAKYNAKVADLGKWNPGTDLKLLKTGDKLIVRRPEPPLTVRTRERRTVRSQETVDGTPGLYEFEVEIMRQDGERKADNILSRKLIR